MNTEVIATPKARYPVSGRFGILFGINELIEDVRCANDELWYFERGSIAAPSGVQVYVYISILVPQLWNLQTKSEMSQGGVRKMLSCYLFTVFQKGRVVFSVSVIRQDPGFRFDAIGDF